MYEGLARRVFKYLLLLALIIPVFAPILVPNARASSLTASAAYETSIGTNSLELGFHITAKWSTIYGSATLKNWFEDTAFQVIRIQEWRDSNDPCITWNSATHTGTWDWTKLNQILDWVDANNAKLLICFLSFTSSGSGALPGGTNTPHMAKDPVTLMPDPDDYAEYVRDWVEHIAAVGHTSDVPFYEIGNEAWHFYSASSPSATKLNNYIAVYKASQAVIASEQPAAYVGQDGGTLTGTLSAFDTQNCVMSLIDFHKYDTGSTTSTDSYIYGRAESYMETDGSYYLSPSNAKAWWFSQTGQSALVINSECNLNYAWSPTTDHRIQYIQGAVWEALVLRTEVLDGGTDYHVYFDEYAGSSPSGFGYICYSPLKQYYGYYVYKWLGNWLGSGDSLVSSTSSSSNLRVMAWNDTTNWYAMLIHKSTASDTVTFSPTGINYSASATEYKIDNTYAWSSAQAISTIHDISSGSCSVSFNGYGVAILQGLLSTEEVPTGTLVVTSVPSPAPITVNGGSQNTPYGAELATGSYTIVFQAITGYTSPATQIVDVTEGYTTTVNGVYTPVLVLGTLQVSSTPFSVPITVNGTSHNTPWSSQYADGYYQVVFGNITGYNAPATQLAHVVNATTAHVYGSYTSIPSTVVRYGRPFTAAPNLRYLISGSNTSFTLGKQFSFSRVGVNTTNIDFAKEYTTDYYGRYGFWDFTCYDPSNYTVALPIDWTLSELFPTSGRSYATLILDGPTGHNVTFQAHSPEWSSVTVTGAVAWEYDNDTGMLYVTASPDTSGGVIRIDATITPSYIDSWTPEVIASITNMDVGSWLFTESKFYNFQLKLWDGDTYLDLVSAQVSFYDGAAWYNVSYIVASGETTVVSGEEIIKTKASSSTSIDLSNNELTVTIYVWLGKEVLDTYGSTIYAQVVDRGGLRDSYARSSYFNIYNLGGRSFLTTTGSAGRTTGGDIFELWAGGYTPANILEDDFDGSDLLSYWTTYVPNGSSIETSGEWPHSGDRSLRFIDASATYPVWARCDFGSNITGTIYWQSYVSAWGTDVWFGLFSGSGGAGGTEPTIWFNSTGYIRAYDGGNWVELQAYTSETWYNVTFAINTVTGKYDVYIDGVQRLNQGDFTSTALRYFYYSDEYSAGPNVNLGKWFIDDVKIWRSWSGGTGGTATTTVLFQNLQAFHSQFAIGIPDGDQMINGWFVKGYNASSYVEASLEYWFNGEWVEGERVRISVADGAISGTENFVKLIAAWYQDGVFVKRDTYYTFWEGVGSLQSGAATGGVDYARIYLDLWFNKANGSRLMGGRTNSYFFGVRDNANFWLKPFTGQNWGPMIDDVTQSQLFNPIPDGSGGVISSKQIRLMRLKMSVHVDSTYDYTLKLRDFNEFNILHDVKYMEGVDTPAIMETRMPQMAQSGIFAALSAIFAPIVERIIKALITAIGTVIGVIIGFLDYIFTRFGWTNGFSVLLGWIQSLIGWVPQGFTWMISFLTQIFTVLTISVPLFLGFLTSFIATGLSVIYMLAGLWTAISDFFALTWTYIDPFWTPVSQLIPLAPVLVVIYLLYQCTTGQGDKAWEEIKLLYRLVLFVTHIALGLYHFLWDTAHITLQIVMGLLDVF